MSRIRVAINGFGRIGRNAFKIAFERNDIEVVAINDTSDIKTLAYLLKHDSNYGTYQYSVESNKDSIIVADKEIKCFSEPNPELLPWSKLDIDAVIESTGRFTKKEDAELHIKAGAKKVVISSQSKSSDVETIILGVNEDNIDEVSQVICNASCTTHSVGPLLSILESEFGVQKSILTTIHSFTSVQSLTDSSSRDHRLSRCATKNIIPTGTIAIDGIKKIIPQLDKRFDGLSLRIPISIVSISDLTVVLEKNTTVDELNEILTRASKEPYYKGILGVSNEPLVSSDYIGNSFSGVVDLALTKVVDGNLVKLLVWYDNEWGYSNRLVELTADFGRSLHN